MGGGGEKRYLIHDGKKLNWLVGRTLGIYIYLIYILCGDDV